MNSGNDEQRWRGSDARRGQGRARNMPRDGNYSGQGYNNQNSNGNTNAWGGGGGGGRGGMNQNHHHHHHQQQQHSQSGGNAGYYEQHVPVNGFNPQEAIEMLTRAYDTHIQAARSSLVDGDKPTLYKGDKGWSTPRGSNNAWGSKRNAMATGNDFLAQLKKSHQALQQSNGRADQGGVHE